MIHPVFWNKRKREWSLLRIHAPVTLMNPFTSTLITQIHAKKSNDIFDDT